MHRAPSASLSASVDAAFAAARRAPTKPPGPGTLARPAAAPREAPDRARTKQKTMADSHQYMTSGAKRQKVDEYAGYAAQAQYGADKAHQKQASAYEFSQHKMNTAVAQSSGRARAPASKIAIRHAAGKTWRDDTLEQWPEGDFRLFVGNIGNEVTDELLSHSFGRYPSLSRAKVIRNKHTNKSKGFAFISFMDPFDCAKALREMTGKYIGNRPCKLMKSTWNERTLSEVRKRDKKKRKAQQSWGISS